VAHGRKQMIPLANSPNTQTIVMISSVDKTIKPGMVGA